MAHYLIYLGQQPVEEHVFESLDTAKLYAEQMREQSLQQVVIKEMDYPHLTYCSKWHINGISGHGEWTAWKKLEADWQ